MQGAGGEEGREKAAEAATSPAEFVRIEARALSELAERLEGNMAADFARAVDLVAGCSSTRGRVVVTGMGKSGIIAQKIAATLSSTGSPALFLHPAEALHGDLGVLARGDVVIALSASGETEEILRLLATLKRIGDALISFCCDMGSTLAKASDVALDCSVAGEACSLGLAPTASTTAMLAMGDALAVSVAERRGFRAEDFAELHPGGRLGKKLMRVKELMHTGAAVPMVQPRAAMKDVIYEMSRKGLGMTTVVDEAGVLVGLLSDGDLRRLLERDAARALELDAGQAMKRGPATIRGEELAVRALAQMEERKITSLVVVDEGQKVEGVIHLHDLWGTELF